MIHCDLHVENVLFTPTGPVLLDWQTVAWGPPAVDLARILCEALSADLRHVRRYQAQRAVSDEAVAAALDRLLAGIVSSRWFRVPGGPTPRSRALLEHGLTTWIAARDLFA